MIIPKYNGKRRLVNGIVQMWEVKCKLVIFWFWRSVLVCFGLWKGRKWWVWLLGIPERGLRKSPRKPTLQRSHPHCLKQ